MNGVSAEQAKALYDMTDDEMRAYLNGLNDEQRDLIYAALDGADAEAQTRDVDLEVAAQWYRDTYGWPVQVDGDRLTTTAGPDGCGYDVLQAEGVNGMRSLAEIKHSKCPPDCCETEFCQRSGPLEAAVGRVITSTQGRLVLLPCSGAEDGTQVRPGLTLHTSSTVELPPSRSGALRASWLAWPPTPDDAA